MKKVILFLTAALPMGFAIFTVQSCAGEGGIIGGGGGGGTAISEAFRALWPPEQQNASFVGSNTCGQTGCHGPGTLASGNGSIHEQWQLTRHFEKNVGCENCHGPGSAHAASPTAANILTFPKVISPIVCAQCHGKVFDEWNASGHKQLVSSPVQSAASNPAGARSARCVSCHSGLFRTQVYEKGRDFTDLTDGEIRTIAENTLAVMPHIATCATCHNPHSVTGKLSDEGRELQLRHLVFNTDTAPVAPGQTADVFTKYEHICAQCHNGRGANGGDSGLAATARPNMHDSNQYNMLMGIGGSEGTGPVERNMAHATAPGQCTHCHMPDSRHTFTVSYDKGCAPCHTAADAAARQATLSNEITSKLYALRTRMENWAISTFTGRPGYENVDTRLIPFLWDYSALITQEASEMVPPVASGNLPPANHQANVPIEVRRARHNYYFVIRDSSLCPHNPPYARHLLLVANANMDVVSPGAQGRAPIRIPSLRERLAVFERDRARAKRADMNAMDDK